MNSSQLKNEADVREDIAVPFLRALGYARGTENDIEREHFLRYEALQLGRKKSNDLPLGGKADYLLTVAGAGRWILETKPPDEKVDLDTIDQAISYARHPEVCGHYAAILNGRRFVLFDRSRSSNDSPLIDIQVTTGEVLAQTLESLLSPTAIRRDCGPPKADLSKGLAKGFRSAVEILGGEITHVDNRWDIPAYLPQQVREAVEASTQKLHGYISTVKGGKIWRDDDSRIRAQLKWNLPHEELISFMQASKFEDFEYVCLDSTISDDQEKPSIFEVLGAFRLEAGQRIFNVLRWNSQVMQMPLETTILCQATGFLKDDSFAGVAVMQQVMRVSTIPDPITFHSEMKFSVRVDTR
jgi:hypothetical protein